MKISFVVLAIFLGGTFIAELKCYDRVIGDLYLDGVIGLSSCFSFVSWYAGTSEGNID